MSSATPYLGARANFNSRLVRAVLSLPPAYAGLIVLLLIASATRPILVSPLFLMLILRQSTPLGLIAIGQSMVVRCNSIDLSSGGVIAATSYLLSSGYVSLPDAVLVGLCLAMGTLVGLVNGLIITRLRASSVIVTLSISIILSGIVIAFSQLRAPGDVPGMLRTVGTVRVGGFPIAPFVWVALLIPMHFVLSNTVFGRFLDAVGSNPVAASMSAIPHKRVILIAHVVSAVFSVLGGFVLLGFVGVGSVNIGQDLALSSLAASILGGVSFGGGRGGMLGPAAAAVMLNFLFNLLSSFGLGEPGKLMLQGGIVLVAAFAYSQRQQ